jgi:hypothetical protein
VFTNIVVGKPIFPAEQLLAFDEKDWEENEKDNTLFTEERFLPKLLVDAGVVQSTSEVRRNQPFLVQTLNKPDVMRIKWGKKIVWIVVGQ